MSESQAIDRELETKLAENPPLQCVSQSMPISSPILRASWSSTLRLPKSAFPARAVLADRPKYLKQCTDDLYAWQRNAFGPPFGSKETFTLHDGPPYANGSLHIGHALNKILKDIICRFQVSQGKRVEYIPGWDCHGLPIELKALQRQKELGQLSEDRQYEAPAIRKLARQLAADTVEEQKKGFREWGIMADWDNAWKTMDRKFELGQLKVFKMMVEKGLIYRRFKPVYWSPSTHTALAEAELEYKADHVSKAAFVKVLIVKLPEQLTSRLGDGVNDLSAVIWTTTPWTLPANKVIAVHSDLDYVVVDSIVHGPLLIAASRVSHVEKLCGEQLSLRANWPIRGSDLVGALYRHPVLGDHSPLQKILHADFVSSESGSGLVHIAPGHGMDDYKLCQQYGIETFAPVDQYGCFTHEAMPHDAEILAGKEVLYAGNKAVLQYLSERQAILASHNHTHSYPYDWRSKKPVIVRATEQWFADVGDLRNDALDSLNRVKFIPGGGRERLASFVRNRSEWCISRQRAWGVPIPALYHKETGASLLTSESVEHIISVIQDRGIDAWWTDEEFDPVWTPPQLRNESQYRRGKDTMDVWFDSGTSWTQMGAGNESSVTPTADVYLEGTDQHRGWFQSSLLTSIAYQAACGRRGELQAPYKTLITHGFTLDQHGKKMSKSVGNVISPDEIINGTLLPPIKRKNANGGAAQNQPVMYDALGPDALRLWAAGCDYTRDVIVSLPVLKAVNGTLSKLRVTLKLLLGLLDTHQLDRQIDFATLGTIDQLALIQLKRLNVDVLAAYQAYDFHKAISTINQYVVMELSAFYIESIKDRLYADAVESESRIQAQIVLWEIFKVLTNVLAPITPLLIEEACDYLPQQLAFHPVKFTWTEQDPPTRVFGAWENQPLEQDLLYLVAANTAVKAAQELSRAEKKMGSSLQSFVLFEFDNAKTEEAKAVREVFMRNLQALNDLLVVSGVGIADGTGADPTRDAAWSYRMEFTVDKQVVVALVCEPQLPKCVRCWKYTVRRLEVPRLDEELCPRCIEVVKKLDLGA
ncbi:isoleucine-tRNA ligase [Trapelia coarctata]|nr:isoleucine-tRNA ligase [Trapelia coarctata]